MATRLIKATNILEASPSEQAKILSHSPQAGGYALLRLLAPRCAASAQPGTMIHLSSGKLTHMTPLLRANPDAGWIDILYSATSTLASMDIATGTDHRVTLSTVPGGALTLPDRPYPLLIGDAVGTAPVVFMADRIRQQKNLHPLVLLGYDTAPPFIAAPSRILAQGMPSGVIAAIPLLDDWGIPSRLAHSQGQPGCFEGTVDTLAGHWLGTLSDTQWAETEIIVSGSNALINAVTALAHQYQMPCQTRHLTLA